VEEPAFEEEVVPAPRVAYPASIDEALSLLGDDVKVLAGGQSLLVLLRFGLVAPETLVSLRRVPGLTELRESPDGGLAIGAMVTQHDLARNSDIQRRYQALAEAASVVASPAVRRMGTIGGNLCHADPTGDPPAALIALDAEVEIASSQGSRRLPVEALFADYMETVLGSNELLTAIHLPPHAPRFGSAYVKHRLRAVDTALVGVGFSLQLSTDDAVCDEVRIGLAGAGVTPLRATDAEAALRGQGFDQTRLHDAAERAAHECAPLDDTEGSEWYRREMVRVFVERAGTAAFARAQG
jgi:carbon-monoxide dehydrogenase medium subunit